MKMEKLCVLIIVIPFALGCEPMNEGVRCRVWGQNMRRFRESTILEIEYLSHPVDLSQFPRLRKFVARETVVSCDDVLHSETTIVIRPVLWMMRHRLFADHSGRDDDQFVSATKYRLCFLIVLVIDYCPL